MQAGLRCDDKEQVIHFVCVIYLEDGEEMRSEIFPAQLRAKLGLPSPALGHCAVGQGSVMCAMGQVYPLWALCRGAGLHTEAVGTLPGHHWC